MHGRATLFCYVGRGRNDPRRVFCSISRPTDVARAGRPARAQFVRRFRRATIAISSELYLRHVTRASPLFVRASGH